MVDFSVDTIEFFYSYDKYREYEFSTKIVNPCSEVSLDNWETSQVTNVQDAFANCHNLNSIQEGYIFVPYVPMEQIDIITDIGKNYIQNISSKYSVISTNTDSISVEIDKDIINKIFNECYEKRKRYSRNRME